MLKQADLDYLLQLEAEIIRVTGRPRSKQKKMPESLEAKRLRLLSKYIGHQIQHAPQRISVVGDSHTAFFAGCESLTFSRGRRVFTGLFRARYISAFTELLPIFRVFHLGPATAWNAAFKGSSTRSFEKLQKLLKTGDIKKSSKILLVYGEIDIRCHLPKAVIKGKSVKQAVQDTVTRFIKLPTALKELGYEPCIWLPAVIAMEDPSEHAKKTNGLPFVGSRVLRKNIQAEYCSALAKLCDKSGFKFAGITRDTAVCGDDRFVDGYHLSQRLMPFALHALSAASIINPLEGDKCNQQFPNP